MSKLKYTPQGFSYVDVSLEQCLKWGGYGICDGCNKGPFKKLKLIYVLNDTYCEDCFNKWQERAKTYSKEDVEYDLKVQNDNHIRWYSYHLNRKEL